jgi:hypothetical protein
VFFHVAVRAQRLKILQRVVAHLAAFDLVVDLEVLKGAALLASPVVPLENSLHDPPVGPYSQLDPLDLL